MNIIQKRIPMNCNIFQIGDDHLGNAARSDTGWDKMENMVNSSYRSIKPCNNFIVHHGDNTECIIMDDSRYRLYSITKRPDEIKVDSIKIFTKSVNSSTNLQTTNSFFKENIFSNIVVIVSTLKIFWDNKLKSLNITFL